MSDAAATFPTNLEEIAMSVSPEGVKLSNMNSGIEQYEMMRTDMKLNPEEFNDFQVIFIYKISCSYRFILGILLTPI